MIKNKHMNLILKSYFIRKREKYLFQNFFITSYKSTSLPLGIFPTFSVPVQKYIANNRAFKISALSSITDAFHIYDIKGNIRKE